MDYTNEPKRPQQRMNEMEKREEADGNEYIEKPKSIQQQMDELEKREVANNVENNELRQENKNLKSELKASKEETSNLRAELKKETEVTKKNEAYTKDLETKYTDLENAINEGKRGSKSTVSILTDEKEKLKRELAAAYQKIDDLRESDSSKTTKLREAHAKNASLMNSFQQMGAIAAVGKELDEEKRENDLKQKIKVLEQQIADEAAVKGQPRQRSLKPPPSLLQDLSITSDMPSDSETAEKSTVKARKMLADVFGVGPLSRAIQTLEFKPKNETERLNEQSMLDAAAENTRNAEELQRAKSLIKSSEATLEGEKKCFNKEIGRLKEQMEEQKKKVEATEKKVETAEEKLDAAEKKADGLKEANTALEITEAEEKERAQVEKDQADKELEKSEALEKERVSEKTVEIPGPPARISAYSLAKQHPIIALCIVAIIAFALYYGIACHNMIKLWTSSNEPAARYVRDWRGRREAQPPKPMRLWLIPDSTIFWIERKRGFNPYTYG